MSYAEHDPQIDARTIRLNVDPRSTQESFAGRIGVPVKAWRNWEQRRQHPTGAALVLVALLARSPAALDLLTGDGAPTKTG